MLYKGKNLYLRVRELWSNSFVVRPGVIKIRIVPKQRGVLFVRGKRIVSENFVRKRAEGQSKHEMIRSRRRRPLPQKNRWVGKKRVL